MAAKCGKCGATGQTVAQIRACYGVATGTVLTKAPTAAPKVATPTATTEIPESKYALARADGTVIFYDVTHGKKKWEGYTFVSHLVGHPGTWATYPVKGAAKAEVLSRIAADPKAAALLYSTTFTVCACCGAPLSDPESLAAGFGPVCVLRFS